MQLGSLETILICCTLFNNKFSIEGQPECLTKSYPKLHVVETLITCCNTCML